MLDSIHYFVISILQYLDSVTGSLGWSIIIFTLGVRLSLIPITLPSLKVAKRMRELQPKIKKLKAKFKKDNVGLQKAQMELYKEHQINPSAGCLPQIVQLVVLIILYRVFINFLQNDIDGMNINFFWLNLSQPDKKYILPVLAAASQFILSLMISPATDTSAEHVLANSTKTKKDDIEANNMDDMASTMQQQMMFTMPIMTGFIATRFPSGLALYWVVGTIVSIIQQYLVSGWGGLNKYIRKFHPNK